MIGKQLLVFSISITVLLENNMKFDILQILFHPNEATTDYTYSILTKMYDPSLVWLSGISPSSPCEHSCEVCQVGYSTNCRSDRTSLLEKLPIVQFFWYWNYEIH